MRAVGVTYADEINAAADEFGVPPALLQAMRDIDDVTLLELPLTAQDYAKQHAVQIGGSSAQYDGGVTYPASNFMAAAWFLYQLAEMTGSEWSAVAWFYGGGPVGRIKASRIAAGPYERRRRQWA